MSTTLSIQEYLNQNIWQILTNVNEWLMKGAGVRTDPESAEAPEVVQAESSASNKDSMDESNSMCLKCIAFDVPRTDTDLDKVRVVVTTYIMSSISHTDNELSILEDYNSSTRIDSFDTTRQSIDSEESLITENKFAVIIYTGACIRWNAPVNVRDTSRETPVILAIEDKLPLLAIEDTKQSEELNESVFDTTSNSDDAFDEEANDDDDDIISISSNSSWNRLSSPESSDSQMPDLVEMTNDRVSRNTNNYDIRRQAMLHFSNILDAQVRRFKGGSLVTNVPGLPLIPVRKIVSVSNVVKAEVTGLPLIPAKNIVSVTNVVQAKATILADKSKHVSTVQTKPDTHDDSSNKVTSSETMPSPQFVLPMFPSIRFQGLFAPVTNYSPPNFGNHAWFHPEKNPTNVYFPKMPLEYSNRPMNQTTCYA